jgi:hypothetical protein
MRSFCLFWPKLGIPALTGNKNQAFPPRSSVMLLLPQQVLKRAPSTSSSQLELQMAIFPAGNGNQLQQPKALLHQGY